MIADIGRPVAEWWQAMQPSDEVGKQPRGDRAGLARLRRCARVIEATFEPAVHRLCHRLDAGEEELDRVALIAAVLAHVRKNNPAQKVARQIGVSREGTALMSDLRFRRLLQADTPDEQLAGFRRLVALAGRELDVADLARSLRSWNEADRRRWVYAYHDAPDFQAVVREDAP